MAHPRSGGPESFRQYVDKSDECWRWTGTHDANGYPVFKFWEDGKKRTVGAHRFAYEQEHGPLPRNIWVRRTCGTPGCVRLAHLHAATPSEAGTMPQAERDAHFWAGVDRQGPDECWPWLRGTTPQGYGSSSWAGSRKPRPAHSVALQLATGVVPLPGSHVCHHCDNPPCCNPAHLYLGDAKTNARDKADRDRFPHLSGVQGTNAKLSADDVRTIRSEHAAGAHKRDLAARFGVHPQTIYNVVTRRGYRDIN